MLRWLPFLLVFYALPAAADLYTVEKDGEIFITTKPVRGGKILYHVKDDPQPGQRANKRRSTSRPSKPTGQRRARKRKGKKPSRSESARAQPFASIVHRAAEHYGMPTALVWAVIKTESGFNPRAVSRVGAQGLMQMMPFTSKEMGVDEPFEPEGAIFGGTRYLRLLANRFDGDLVLTLSAYHAGGGAVSSANGIPFTQTAEYVRRVLNAYYRYQQHPPAKP
jgi:soluble lytic murein transglycosylase-like protein